MLEFYKTKLPSGVTIVSERHPQSPAVSLGLWVASGTRDEPDHLGGVSHLVEHLVFKGTKTRSAYQIARALEAVGGELNAFTSREYTCFHTLSLKEDARLSLQILADLLTQATFRPDEFEREKQVVLQELLMAEDNLEDYIFDLFFERAYGRHPLARPILGTRKSLEQMSRAQVFEYYQRVYARGPLIVSAAGQIDHNELVKWCERCFAGRRGRPSGQALQQSKRRRAPKLRPIRELVKKPAEQVHLMMALPIGKFSDPNRFESFVVNAILGGGMTSRLYQSVRERRGLAYSIYSQLQSFTDSGMLTIYAAAQPSSIGSIIKICERELERLLRRGVSRADLKLFRTQVKGGILLGADDVENRMNSLGVNEMVFGDYRPVEAVIAEIERLSVDSVNSYIERYVQLDRLASIQVGAVESI